MSFVSITLGFLAIKPKTETGEDYLVASSPFISQLLTFFSSHRWMRVDLRRRRIELKARSWWFLRKEWDIPYQRIDHLLPKFKSWGTSWGGLMTGYERTDQLELYTVFLVLRNPREEIKLFGFFGEGSSETGWKGVMLGGDSMIDYRGDQEEKYYGFVDLFQYYTGAPIGEPPPGLRGSVYRCKDCGRQCMANWRECMYCNGEIVKELV